jgi:hypothetical protein
MSRPSYLDFNAKIYRWKTTIDYRKHPEQYHIGKGEQGVLICEPYKSELLKYWKFKTPDDASKSSLKLYRMFINYVKTKDFVGADMARKYLQMGFTRSRRYANYKGGRKYTKNTHILLARGSGDKDKALSATIFYKYWKKAEKNSQYVQWKKEWKMLYG